MGYYVKNDIKFYLMIVFLIVLLLAGSVLFCDDPAATTGPSTDDNNNCLEEKTPYGYCLILDADNQAKCVQFDEGSPVEQFEEFCNEAGEDPFPIYLGVACPEEYRHTRCEFDSGFGTGIAFSNENIDGDEAFALCNYLGGTAVVKVSTCPSTE